MALHKKNWVRRVVNQLHVPENVCLVFPMFLFFVFALSLSLSLSPPTPIGRGSSKANIIDSVAANNNQPALSTVSKA